MPWGPCMLLANMTASWLMTAHRNEAWMQAAYVPLLLVYWTRWQQGLAAHLRCLMRAWPCWDKCCPAVHNCTSRMTHLPGACLAVVCPAACFPPCYMWLDAIKCVPRCRCCERVANTLSNSFAEACSLVVPEEPSAAVAAAPANKQDLFDDDDLDAGSAMAVRGCVLLLPNRALQLLARHLWQSQGFRTRSSSMPLQRLTSRFAALLQCSVTLHLIGF